MYKLPPIFPSILSITHLFSGILLDAYGVFWGGNQVGLLPGVDRAMKKMVEQGKVVGILSNSTQLIDKEQNKWEKHGLYQEEHYHFVITSGWLTQEFFRRKLSPFAASCKKFWVLGTPHPHFSPIRIFEKTDCRETKEIEEADFIYVGTPHIGGKDQTDPQVFEKQVEAILPFHLPMVCSNPDLFAHEGSPPALVVRQGSIARLYQKMGGEVWYIGKPYSFAYQEAMKVFSQKGIDDCSQVLMVGDTPETDIRGARLCQIPAALITETGIMAERLLLDQDAWNQLSSSDLPDFCIKRLGG